MGTPVIELELGADCYMCMGVGHTPLRVWSHFMGLELCPEVECPLPNGMTFEMIQSPDWPCEWWKFDIYGWSVWFRISDSYSQLRCWWREKCVFNAIRFEHCPLILTNDDSCIDMYARYGRGWITYPVSPIPFKLASEYGLTGMSKVLYDILPCGIDHAVVRLCRRSDKTNVLVYCDLEEF